MPVYAPLPCAFGALLAQYTLLLADNDGSADNDRCFDALPYQLSSSKLTAIRSKLIQYEVIDCSIFWFCLFVQIVKIESGVESVDGIDDTRHRGFDRERLVLQT